MQQTDGKTCVVVGGGGREHSLAWKLLSSSDISRVHVIPGNPGMALTEGIEVHADCSEMEDWVERIEKLAPAFVVIGPEKPLVKGLADVLREKEIPVIGPDRGASQLEGSKIFSKVLMSEFLIPTAAFKIAEHEQEALEVLEQWEVERKGVVIKADNLASGKGVVVTYDREKAVKVVHDFLRNPDCVVNADKLVFEEVLQGREVSVFALCDGEDYHFLGHACDYKRLLDDDQGPNTGGMGCFTDPSWPTDDIYQKIQQKIMKPLLAGMKRKGHPYRGFLFLGLMIRDGEPYVVEYNIRLGDPEAQTLLPLIQGDFAELLQSSLVRGGLTSYRERLNDQALPSNRAAVHVVAASQGYPSLHGEAMSVGHQIRFDKELTPTKESEGPFVFFAGVNKNKAGRLMNSGGRVLGVSAVAEDVEKARTLAYQSMERIKFEGMSFRGDIAKTRG